MFQLKGINSLKVILISSRSWKNCQIQRTMATSARSGSYDEAIKALNTLQSNAQIIEKIRKSGGKLNDLAIPEMIEYLERIGWKQEDLNDLNVIHITGTKGKGSTAAFVDSLIRNTSKKDENEKNPLVGLYTSPHLVEVRERIRINGKPIEKDEFTKYFWQVWNRLEENPKRKTPEITPLRPVYFRFLTILAFHIFKSLKVNCTILEVGIGGRFDSTNIVLKPIVTGISTLGLDHTALLGNSIEEIAFQKVGIFKPKVDAISVWQEDKGAREVIKKEANKVGVKSFLQLESIKKELPFLGIPGSHQSSNAQLALALYRTFMKSKEAKKVFKSEDTCIDDQNLTSQEEKALQLARWPGRCQIVKGNEKDKITWYLDGAHTKESLESCAKWFIESVQKNNLNEKNSKVLIFNTTHDRKSTELLQGMCKSMRKFQLKGSLFDKVIFTTNITYKRGKSLGDLTSIIDSENISLDSQKIIQHCWKSIELKENDGIQSKSFISSCIEEALECIEIQENLHQHVLICGSLHLVGGIMSHLLDKGLLDDSLNGIR